MDKLNTYFAHPPAFQQAQFQHVMGYLYLELRVIPIFLLRASVRNLFISSALL